MLTATATLLLTFVLQAPADTVAPPQKPLPDRTNFLIEFQVKRGGIYKMMGWMSNVELQSQYTYRETNTEMTLDSKGTIKSSKKQVVEHIPTRLPGYIYERQVVKDGVPLSAKELEKQDRQNEANITKWEAEREKSQADRKKKSEAADRQFEQSLKKDLDRQKLTPEERKAAEQRAREVRKAALSGTVKPSPKMEDSSILQAADFQLVRREEIDGHPVILMTFKPNPNYKGGGNIEKIFQHATGRAWVSEDDYELVKLEADISQAINFGLGLLAKIQPGSRGTFEWRKINNEVWLPSRADFAAKVRILLVKGQNIREVTEYSDHKKFVVSTEIKVQE
jgi:hypothetical protein